MTWMCCVPIPYLTIEKTTDSEASARNIRKFLFDEVGYAQRAPNSSPESLNARSFPTS